MIIDLNSFIKEEKRYWVELEEVLEKLEQEPEALMDLSRVKRFHYLYQRTSADLARIMTFSAELDLRQYLEALVGRAFSEIHETREKAHRFSPLNWFFNTFPRTFRRHVRAFWISLIVMLAGFAFGGGAIIFDTDSKEILMPFSHLQKDPSDRVAEEESADEDRLSGGKSSFSSHLMTHNTRVSIFTMALGITWGIGTIIMLFFNGVLLGAVALDYIRSGESVFLVGWLLPHGSIEIPAIILAGQAGLVLAGALIGWGKPISLKNRLRTISTDLVTLISGVGLMLIWAGIIESFLSQYHEPVIPYEFKIGFGIIELFLLILFLSKSGISKKKVKNLN